MGMASTEVRVHVDRSACRLSRRLVPFRIKVCDRKGIFRHEVHGIKRTEAKGELRPFDGEVYLAHPSED